MSKDLTALLIAENAKRPPDKQLPDEDALKAALLERATTDALTEQENAEINAIAAAYRLLDDAGKAVVRAAAGL